MRPVVFQIGAHPVYAYGLALTIAFVVGAWLGARRARARALAERHVYLTAAWALLSAILGSRILFLIVERPSLLPRPLEWFRIGEGGLVFYGGFFAAVASSALYCAVARVPFWLLADVLAPSIALGHGIVRIGCFLNGCCYGAPASWGVVFPSLGDGIARQPTQLYEAAAGVVLFFGLLAWERWVPPSRSPSGTLILLYAAAYGAVRFLIEFARDDDRGPHLLGLTLSQIVGLSAFALGPVWLIRRRVARLVPRNETQ